MHLASLGAVAQTTQFTHSVAPFMETKMKIMSTPVNSITTSNDLRKFYLGDTVEFVLLVTSYLSEEIKVEGVGVEIIRVEVSERTNERAEMK